MGVASENMGATGVLDLTLPKLPTRSRLYCLEPIGVGTPLVESLTGYIGRLAREHNVTPYALIKFEIAPLIPDVYTIASDSNTGVRGHTAFNSSTLKAAKFVEALERLTMTSGLRYLTLLPWGGVIQLVGLFRSLKAWCPGCYSSQYDSGIPNYDLLLWSFRSMRFCVEHDLTLADKCPYCQSAMNWLAGRSNPGYCTRCFRWLGCINDYEYHSGETTQAENYQRWLLNEIGKVLASAPLLSDVPSRETHTRSLAVLINGVTNGRKTAFARLVKIMPSAIWDWQTGTLPCFDMIARVCYEAGASVSDYLAGTISINQLMARWENNPKIVYQAKRAEPKRGPFNETEKIELLKSALRETPPPTVAGVAKRLGYVNRSRLYDGSFRPYVIKLSARYAKYREKIHKKELDRIRRLLSAELNRTLGRPLSIEEVCRLPDGKRHYTAYRRLFPDICEALKAKHQKYLKGERKKKKEAVAEEIMRIAMVLHGKGEFPSTPRVASLMQRPSHMSRKFARNALREAQLKLGLRIAVTVR